MIRETSIIKLECYSEDPSGIIMGQNVSFYYSVSIPGTSFQFMERVPESSSVLRAGGPWGLPSPHPNRSLGLSPRTRSDSLTGALVGSEGRTPAGERVSRKRCRPF